MFMRAKQMFCGISDITDYRSRAKIFILKSIFRNVLIKLDNFKPKAMQYEENKETNPSHNKVILLM